MMKCLSDWKEREGVREKVEEEGSVIYQHTSISKLALVNSSEFNNAFVAALLTGILHETKYTGGGSGR